MSDAWRSTTLGELAQVNPEQLGSRTDPSFTLEYLDIAAIKGPGVIGPSRTLKFSEAPSRARRRVRADDILVSTVRPYLQNFARIREATNNLVASTGYAVVRPKEQTDGRFLYQHVMSDGFVEFLKPRMRGSNYPAVRSADVEEYYPFFASTSRATQDCRHPLLGGRCHREDPSGHRPSAGRQARADAGAVHAGLAGGGTRGSSRRRLDTSQRSGTSCRWRHWLRQAAGFKRDHLAASCTHPTMSPTDVPVLMPKDMMNGYVSDEDSARIPDDKAKELNRHRARAGDVLFARAR